MEQKNYSLSVIELNETFDDELMSYVKGGGTDDFCSCLLGTKCECNVPNSKVVTPIKPSDGGNSPAVQV